MSAAHLERLGSATLAESGAVPLPSAAVRAMWPGAACAGPARTVRCAPGDNLAIHAALPGAAAGEVLVVEVEGVPERGYWGEVLTTAAQQRGVIGLIIDACVRDTAALAARGLPVFATGTALPGATKTGPGAVGGVVTLAGVRVEPGDTVVADGDGVVVIRAAELPTVLAAGAAREAKEAEMFERLATGATTVDLLGLDDLSSIVGGQGER